MVDLVPGHAAGLQVAEIAGEFQSPDLGLAVTGQVPELRAVDRAALASDDLAEFLERLPRRRRAAEGDVEIHEVDVTQDVVRHLVGRLPEDRLGHQTDGGRVESRKRQFVLGRTDEVGRQVPPRLRSDPDEVCP